MGILLTTLKKVKKNLSLNSCGTYFNKYLRPKNMDAERCTRFSSNFL